ncbi:RHS repeat-associated core domain-containing protein [Chryseobacterium sp. SC28]|uniref:RHS repeat-associated core domain-containing protein n=1 Tax=Chryseobacterium sp. SC28 TaxID=2268028 RepID=UPI001E45DCF0|nr:RHS repeat-associated core domain-containing protein [Chryseobacterium sp. SC28]
METSVSGRTTTVKELNGNLRTTTKTTDVLGNVITSTDKGGTISFSYNATGQQISAQYGTNIVTTAYDDWGRKTEFTDPSNGIYKYEYDGFGRIVIETSPKGTKEYEYNNFGQLYKQKELSTDGTSTSKSITYAYNSQGLITSKVGTANGKAYSSSIDYDTYGRVISSSENSNGKYFTKKGVTYDDKMRVTSYEKSLYSSGIYTKVTIENVYDSWSGELYQVKDKTQNKVLWELQSAEADGRVLTAKLGGTSIANQYDSNNFLYTTQHKNANNNATVLQMMYSFNAIKNELNSRTRGGDFNISESFQYDDNNRLVNWTDPSTGTFTQNAVRNSYDDKGRILNNDQVGEIKFNNTNKIYQATGMVLNTAGQQNFNQNLLQKITYNENNDPIFIDGLKGDVRFEYGLSEMRQEVHYGGNSSLPLGEGWGGDFTKYYSEDGGYEIVRNNQTGQEKHILYIGGAPYESNIVYLKDYTESSGSYKFLHKDYLGSILAISDETGNAVEQRHYDAWGNFTHLKIGSQTMIVGVQQVTDYLANNNLLLDRGYTSHEHFSEVGLIHMNGRLYDPILRRFLNADENIQDPYNTQNYNKYGYVMNNPLMYNDPNGEFIWFLPAIWAATHVFWATVITGAVIGAAIGAGMYAIQAQISGNWSWGGFGKSILMGSVTGAVSAGLGQVFSASGFWGSVGNAALAGAGSDGVASIINGTNFLEGLTKGAVIGGAVAGITYTMNFYSKTGGKQAGAKFGNGKAEIDLSKGFGAHDVDPEVLNTKIQAKYVGQYRGVNVYESSVGFGSGSHSGGLTLPPNQMVVGKGAYSLRDIFGKSGTYDLFTHEYGHVLQAKKVGEAAFYDIIATSSLYSATTNTYDGHNQFWTETWANQLSYDYFSNRNLSFNLLANIAKPLSQKYIDIFTNYLSIRGFSIPTSWNTIP